MPRNEDETLDAFPIAGEATRAATAKDRRSRKIRRQEDKEALNQLDEILTEHGTQFRRIVEHIDSEWVIIERLKAETREILQRLQPA